jgi:hypothetical protein
MNKITNTPNHLIDPIDTPNEIWLNKVGYDSANKRMVAKVYKHLYNVMTLATKPFVCLLNHILLSLSMFHLLNQIRQMYVGYVLVRYYFYSLFTFYFVIDCI